MGLGAGHAMDMINRMKQNRALRLSNRSKFKENNRDGIYSSEKKTKQLNFKTVPEHKLNKIKTGIWERAKTERKREWVIYGISLIVLIVAIIGIIEWRK